MYSYRILPPEWKGYPSPSKSSILVNGHSLVQNSRAYYHISFVVCYPKGYRISAYLPLDSTHKLQFSISTAVF
jgi:hypothetical protein